LVAAPEPEEYPTILEELEIEMKRLADALEFEQAAEIRDKIEVLRSQLEVA
jgi:excinuclease UvrABC helicase subunit UvrB